MKRLQTFKFQLSPNGQQAWQMSRFFGSCWFAFNKALALQKVWYQIDPETKFSYVKLANLLPSLKKNFPWLMKAPSQALQQILKDLDRAYQNFFAKRATFPKFKRKGMSNSFSYSQGVRLHQSNGRIFLSKLSWMRYHNSREALGTIKIVTVSFAIGHWFVSIQTEREMDIPTPNGGMIGIDMGITCFATLSGGSFFNSINSFKQYQDALLKICSSKI